MVYPCSAFFHPYEVMPLNSRKIKHIFKLNKVVLEVVMEYVYRGMKLPNGKLTSLIRKHISINPFNK